PKDTTKTCTHRVQVQRSLDGHSLSFELQAGSVRRVLLPMPDEAHAVQLLKGQFDDEVQAPPPNLARAVPRVALTLPPVISSAGNYVALRL
ncbi:hypothetical protein NK322_24125, partial [Salmonella enterica]|nr:hypothetical protein [Salmonella enterica]